MKKFYISVFLIITTYNLFSQITLNSNNFPFGGMSYSRVYAGADTIGPAGENVFFDFSTAFIVLNDTLKYYNIAATPFQAEHPASEMAIHIDDGNGQHRYYYYSKDANAFWEDGFTLIADLGAGIDTFQSVYNSADVDTLISNQYTYGHTETEHSKGTLWANIAVNVDLHKTKIIEVDAWGSMDTPFNHFDDVIRVKYEDYRADSIFLLGAFNSVNNDTLYYYHYYAKDVPYPVVIAHTDNLGVMQYIEVIKVAPVVLGCTDPLAVNYSPIANTDDGSCIYCSAFSFSTTADTSICEGETIVLTVIGGNEWNWSTGESTSSISVSPSENTQYSVYVSNQPLCWESGNILVNVNKPTIADFYMINNTFDIEDSVQFINLSQEAANYYWDLDDTFNGISYSENPLHKYSYTGDKNIMLIASNNCYSDTTYKTITITDINEIEALISYLNVYPNPGNDNSTVEFSSNENTLIELNVFDIYGRLCATKALRSNQNKILIKELSNNLPPGTYIINLRNGDQFSNVKWIKL